MFRNIQSARVKSQESQRRPALRKLVSVESERFSTHHSATVQELGGFALGCLGLYDGGGGLGPERGQKLVERKRVDHVFLFQPSAARSDHAVLHEAKVSGVVSVSGDDDSHAPLFGHAEVNVFEIEAA